MRLSSSEITINIVNLRNSDLEEIINKIKEFDCKLIED